MLRDYVAILEVAGDSRDLGVRTASFIEEDAVALCRHLLSQ